MTRLANTPDTLRLAPEDLDEIRAGVDWQALFSGLGLRKAERKSRPNDWWAFSPFHEEKTPSFHMGPGGVWYDFSIGEGGGAIELVQRIENCDCFEAARFIIDHGWSSFRVEQSAARRNGRGFQRRVGKAIAETPETLAPLRNEPIRQDLIPLCTRHDILEERGISDEACDLLGIGYLPQGRSPMKGRIVFQIADARPGESGELDRVILSHIGRAVKEGQEPKYLFYEGFHKSAELYGQELLALHEDAAEQAKATGHILLTEGPFDLAKIVSAGLRNGVASLGATLSETQSEKLAAFADDFGIRRILIAYDRDDAGKAGADKAANLLTSLGLEPVIFDWEAPVGRSRNGPVHIPAGVNDLADLSTDQIDWLRRKGQL